MTGGRWPIPWIGYVIPSVSIANMYRGIYHLLSSKSGSSDHAHFSLSLHFAKFHVMNVILMQSPVILSSISCWLSTNSNFLNSFRAAPNNVQSKMLLTSFCTKKWSRPSIQNCIVIVIRRTFRHCILERHWVRLTIRYPAKKFQVFDYPFKPFRWGRRLYQLASQPFGIRQHDSRNSGR